jgi:hypothetical protein
VENAVLSGNCLQVNLDFEVMYPSINGANWIGVGKKVLSLLTNSKDRLVRKQLAAFLPEQSTANDGLLVFSIQLFILHCNTYSSEIEGCFFVTHELSIVDALMICFSERLILLATILIFCSLIQVCHTDQ